MIPPAAVAVSVVAAFALNALAALTLTLLLALLLRHPLCRLAGPRIAYALWLLPPVAVLATLWTSLHPAAIALPYRVHLDAGMLVLAHAMPARVSGAMLPAVPLLLMVWSAGSACALLLLAWRYLALCRGLRTPPADSLAKLRREHALPRAQRLAIHAAGPALLWAPRPLLLLPPDFAQRYDTTQQMHILRHELCHRAQGDAWWNLLAALLGALFWFHPLLPWARRCFQIDQELACDALLLQRHHAVPRAYAGTLLQAATGTTLPLASGVAHPRQLKERIAMLAQTRRSAPRRAAGATLIMILLSGAVLAAPSPVPAVARTVAGMNPPTQDFSFNDTLPPRYPIDAVKKHEQGTVYLIVLVSTQGMPLSIKQVHEPGPQPAQDLVNASLQAAVKWRFKPATRDGRPIASWIKVPVTFKLYPIDVPASQAAHKPSA